MRGAIVLALVVLAGCQQPVAEPPKGMSEEQTKAAISAAVAGAKSELTKEREAAIKALRDELLAKVDLADKKREHLATKLEADKAKEQYQSDTIFLATRNEEERELLLSVQRKVKSGEVLTPEELRIASELHGLRDSMDEMIGRTYNKKSK